eukprot:1679847-Rhodomonas_salina.1
MDSYQCAFSLRSVSNPSQNQVYTTEATVVSAVTLDCLSARWPEIDRDATLQFLSGGSTSPANGSDSFDFAFFPEWVVHRPTFADRLGGVNAGRSPAITVTGFGFDPSYKYSCTFSGLRGGAVNQVSSNEVVARDINTLVCVPPEWDRSSTWTAYPEAVVNLTVVENDGVGTSTMFTLNGSSAPGQVPSRFVQINNKPNFEGSSVLARERTRSFIPDWGTDIVAGLAEDGSEVVVEQSQNLSFVLVDVGDGNLFSKLFADGPMLYENGTLAFTASDRAGVAFFAVTLFDDAGTDYQGIDKSPDKFFTIEVLPDENFPSIEVADPVIIVYENDPRQCIPRFVDNVGSNDLDEFMQRRTFGVTAEAEYFSLQPRLSSEGELRFTVAPHVFGNVSIDFGVTVYSFSLQTTNTTQLGSATIRILQVNSEPSFVLQTPTVSVNEGSCIDPLNPCTFTGFVSDILPGPNVTDGPKGELWSESDQIVTFSVSAPAGIFLAGPDVSATGDLTFTLEEYVSGSIPLTITLKDDGGTDGNGVDSSSQTLTLEIQAVNDPPFFNVSCSQASSYYECSTCGGSIGACTATVEIAQNCQDCVEPRPVCARGVTIPSFVTDIRASLSPDEASQNLTFSLGTDESSQQLTFSLALDSGFSDLLDGTPTIDAASGDLTLCLALDRTGTSQYSFSLTDDGGTGNGGIDTYGPASLVLSVLPANQRPSFEVCSECKLACCNSDGFGSCCSDYLAVWQSSGLTQTVLVNQIVKGNLLNGTTDSEINQTVSFAVVGYTISAVRFLNGTFQTEQTSDPSTIFESNPTIDADGLIRFTLLDEVSGRIVLTVEMADSGGTENGGKNVSFPSQITLDVVAFATEVVFELRGTNLTINSDPMEIRQAIADALGIDVRLVVLQATVSSRRRLLANTLTFTVLIGTVDSSQTITNQTLIPVLAALLNLTNADSITATINPQIIVNPRGFEHFNLANETVSVVEFEHTPGTEYVQELFVTNISAPAVTIAASGGTQILNFNVVPVRYRPFDGAGYWIQLDGADPGLLAAGPTLQSICDPMCYDATLKFNSKAYQNGEIEFRVSMQGTDGSFNRTFSIVVIAVNVPPLFSIPSVLTVLEDAPLTDYEAF